MTRTTLPDLQSATTDDERLRQVVCDQEAFARGIAVAEERLGAARAECDWVEVARLLGYLGDAYRVLYRLDEAIRVLDEALSLSRQVGDQRLIIANTVRLGEANRYRDDIATAEPLLRDAVQLARESKHVVYEGFALQHLGKCLMDAGEFSEAVSVLKESLAIRRASGRDDLVSSTERALAVARAKAVSGAGG
jgi:tetratricopeptide (TPR) repeat protein